jgi:hypothetical protein
VWSPRIRNGFIVLALLLVLPRAGWTAENLFANPGFELVGPGAGEWHIDRGGNTEAEFAVDRQDAGEGERSARVHIGRIGDWGAQFGQSVPAGKQGQTYTFAMLAKAVQQPVKIALEIERRAKPYDRAAKGGPFTLAPGKWTELHVTFTVGKDFAPGWFAYVSCNQPNCEFRADAFRLYEGDYVPFEKLAREEDVAGSVRVEQSSAAGIRVANSFLTLRVRCGAPAVEVLSAQLAPVGAKSITGFRVVENTANRVALEVTSDQNIRTRYAVRKNKPLVEVEGGGRVLVASRSRYAVVPDIFASDLVLESSQRRLRVPNEHVLAQLADDGNAIVTCAWRSPTQTATLTATGMEVSCPVTVAVLAAPNIWQRKKISELDPVKDVKLDHPVPFRALWRADYRRDDGFIDSWKVVIRQSATEWEGFGVNFTKPKARTVWTSARGTFAFPAFIDGDNAFLRRTRFDEPEGFKYKDDDYALLYPLQKISRSPATAWGVFDVLRETAEPQLDELAIKRVPRDRYPATCAVTAEYEAVFDDGKEREKKQFILDRLDAMDNFVIGIRSRIDEYLAWRKATGAFITAQQAAHPQLADEFASVLARFDKRFEHLHLAERTPVAGKALIAKVVALIDSNEPNKAEKAKQIGRDTRTLGGSQDHAIGDFRMLTKELRQRAGYRMTTAQTDAEFEFARAVRERTLAMLRSAFGHESAQTD